MGQNTHISGQTLYGTILNQSVFTSLTGYTTNGATVTTSANKLSFSAGAGSFTQTLDYNYFSGLDKWHMGMTFECTAKGAGSFGIGMGKRSANSFGLYNLTVRIDCTTGGTSGTLILNGGSGNLQLNTSAAQFGTQLTFASNDRVLLTLDRDGYTVTASARNITTNSAPIYTSYTFLTAYPAVDPFMDNLGKFAIFQFAGANTVDSLSVTSNAVKNADYAFVGDSKFQGYTVNIQPNRVGDLWNQNVATTNILAGGSDRTIEISRQCQEIINLHPKSVFLGIGSNDVRQGAESSATYFARYDSIANALTAAGIAVYHTCLYESSISMAAFLAHIVATFPAANVLNTYYPLQAAGAIAGDNVHPNSYGDSIIYNSILQGYSASGGGKSSFAPQIYGVQNAVPKFGQYGNLLPSALQDSSGFIVSNENIVVIGGNSTSRGVSFKNIDAPSNAKWWNYYATSASEFHFATLTDNLITNTDFFTILRSGGTVKRIIAQADTLTFNSQLAASAINLNTVGGLIYLNGSIRYPNSPILPDANYTAAIGNPFYRLPTISSDRIFTFPSGTNTLVIDLYDSNTNAGTKWTLSPSAKDPAGNTLTNLVNGNYYRFIYDGTQWRQSGLFSSASAFQDSVQIINDSIKTNAQSLKIPVGFATTFRNKIVSLTGIDSVKGFGDSYMTGFDGFNTYLTKADISLLAGQFGLKVANYGVGGTGAFVAAKAGSLNITPISNNTLNYIRFGFNDYKRSGVNIPTNKKIAACLSSLIAQNVIDSIYFAGSNAHLVKTGGWTTNLDAYAGFGGKANAGAWGGTAAFSNTAGDSIKTTFVGDAIIIGYGNQTTPGFTGGAFLYYIDDSLAGTQVCDGADGISDGTNSNLVSPGALLIKGCGSGLHKLTIKLPAANFTYIDYIATPKPSRRIAPTLISLIPHLLAAGYAVSPSSGSNAAFDAGDSTILATAAIWQQYNVTVAFPMDYFNPSTDLGPDNVHPKIPGGYQKLALAAIAKVTKDNNGAPGIFQYGASLNALLSSVSAGTVNSQPYIAFYNPAGTANNKLRDEYLDNTGTMHYRMVNDANTTPQDWMFVTGNTSGTTVKIIGMTTDSLLIQNNPGPSANTYEIRNIGARIRLNSMLQYAPSPIISDANYNAALGSTYFRLPVITANRTFVFPTPAREGDIVEILDSNTNASFAWSTTTTPVRDPQNNSISTFVNGNYYKFIFDGVAWRMTSQLSVSVPVPPTNIGFDLGSSALAWRDIYFSHTISQSAIGVSSSLGTNVSSLTPSGSDEAFTLTLVTSGAVSGNIGNIAFGRTWGATPKCTISAANTTTGSGVATSSGGYMALNATSTSSMTMTALITASGTYTFNCHCGQ